MLRTHCEQITNKLSPAVRRQIVLFLHDRGLNGKQISKLLHITPASVSHYLKAKRGAFQLDDNSKKIIKKYAVEILNKPNNIENLFSQCVCEVCKHMR